jgi:hypothetical protein
MLAHHRISKILSDRIGRTVNRKNRNVRQLFPLFGGEGQWCAGEAEEPDGTKQKRRPVARTPLIE